MDRQSKTKYYRLNNREPVPIYNFMEWAEWFETADRVVWQTQHNECEVSTVFLGLDHQYGSGPPLLFETLVFGGDQDGLMERCSTWDEAEKQHNRVLEIVKGNFN